MTSHLRFSISICLIAGGLCFVGSAARADEIWIPPTAQQDLGGLEISSNTIWPVTPIGAVRFAWAIPNDLQTFQSAKITMIPGSPAGPASLNFLVCAAQNGTAVTGACAGPFPQPFMSVANQLVEVDISAALSSHIGAPGVQYLAVLAFTTPTTTTDHILGLRFSYTPTSTDGGPTFGANTFTGTQTAPAFVGDGSGLTNLPLPTGVATLGTNVFSGIQTAPAFVGDGSGLSNVATLGANTFTATQVISFGNLDLGAKGQVTQEGTRLLHTFKGFVGGNTFVGLGAGNTTLTLSGNNTGVGQNALRRLSDSGNNTAVGTDALSSVSSGASNTAVGASALTRTGGNFNTAIGAGALVNLAGGGTTGGADFNTALGLNAGSALTTGERNLYLMNAGVSSESYTVRIGDSFHTRTFIQGIRGKTTGIANAVPVVIDSNGQLGTVSSSIRFKEDIHTMADTSHRLFDLRPVTFRYTQPFADGSKPIQFGLVAEEVAEVFPELAVRGADGAVETVHYETLSVLLLNELQRQQERLRLLEQEWAEHRNQQERLEALEQRLSVLMLERRR